VWEARLEAMAPEIDGKLYLTDIELAGGGVAELGMSRELRLPRRMTMT